MPYQLTQANDPMDIQECQWGQAQAIQFSRFTSCIGVLAKIDNVQEVVGIHLVLVDRDSNQFTASDVALVMQLLQQQNYDPRKTVIIGQIAYWQASATAAYNALYQALNNPSTYQLGDGTYGAEVTLGEINLTFV